MSNLYLNRRTLLKRSAAWCAVGGLAMQTDAATKPRYRMGLQLYTVREPMAKDAVGTLKQAAALGMQHIVPVPRLWPETRGQLLAGQLHEIAQRREAPILQQRQEDIAARQEIQQGQGQGLDLPRGNHALVAALMANREAGEIRRGRTRMMDQDIPHLQIREPRRMPR